MAEIALRKSIIVSKYPNQFPACWVHVSDEVVGITNFIDIF